MIKLIWTKWKKFAAKIGDLQFNLIFSLLYFLLITPFGLVANFFGDFLGLKSPPKWEDVE